MIQVILTEQLSYNRLVKGDHPMKKFIEEFKEFAVGGNLLDMAVGVIVGGAFSSIINSLVEDIFTPLLSMLFGSQTDFSSLKLGQIMIGNFINAVISFLLTALCLFSVVKAINTAKKVLVKEKEEAPAEEPEPSEEVKLLTQIAAELKKLNKK